MNKDKMIEYKEADYLHLAYVTRGAPVHVVDGCGYKTQDDMNRIVLKASHTLCNKALDYPRRYWLHVGAEEFVGIIERDMCKTCLSRLGERGLLVILDEQARENASIELVDRARDAEHNGMRAWDIVGGTIEEWIVRDVLVNRKEMLGMTLGKLAGMLYSCEGALE